MRVSKMKIINTVIQIFKFEHVKSSLSEINIKGLTITDVLS